MSEVCHRLCCFSGLASWRDRGSGKAHGRPQRVVRIILGHVSPVRLRVELPEEYDRSWTGAKIWASGLALADWLARQPLPGVVNGARVLELGCGSAPLPAAVALIRGAAKVVATDGNETAVQVAAANLMQCRQLAPDVDNRLKVEQLDWDSAKASTSPGAFDVIIFADGVYTEAAAIALAACIDHCLSRGPGACVYGVVPNTREGASDFLRQMRRHEFVAVEIDLGPSAHATSRTIEAFENCDRESAIQEGPCVLIHWRRGPLSGVVDETQRLQNHFDEAVTLAEMAVDARLQESGYEPTE